MLPSFTIIGPKDDPYPMLSNIWDFFSSKGTKTVFVSVSSGKTPLPELDLAENIGCPILIFDTSSNCQKWQECKEILKTRKTTDSTSEFAKTAQKKWVLPRNIHIKESFPTSFHGSIDLFGSQVKTENITDSIIEYSKTIGLEEPRLDIMKIEDCPLEADIIHSLIQSGFRPSILLVCWNETPDMNTCSMISAGNLQMVGYSLVAKQDNKFLYYYTDVNFYESCSWEEPSKNLQNPLIQNIVKTIYPNVERNVLAFPKKDQSNNTVSESKSE